MRIVRTLLAAIGATFLVLTVIWFLVGYSGDTQDRSEEKAAFSQHSQAGTSLELENAPRACDPDRTFHLERLRENSSLKVVALGKDGIANVQRFLDLTLQTPIQLSRIPRLKVWVAWQYKVASLGGSAPAEGVIDIVQDNCVLYRRQGDAAEIVAIANGDWSR